MPKHRMLLFVRFVVCLLLALSLLGCAEPLSLGSLHALNPRSYAGTICGIPKGAPPNTRFYAVNAAMGKVVTDRHPDALRDFMSIADSVHEVSTSAPRSSVNTVPISMGVTCPVRQELPADLVAKLNAIVATPCELAENNRPDPHYIAQTHKVPRTPEGIQLQLLVTVLTWGLNASAAPDSQVPRPPDTQTLPLPGLEGLPQTTIAEAETPSLLEHPVTQFSEGAVSGGLIGVVPFGAIGSDVAIEMHLLPKGTYWARVGKACGEIVVGTGEIILGCAGISAGTGMSGTGVGAVPGVLVISGSYALAGNGCLTAGTGLAELHQLWREGDPATNASAGSSAPAPTEPLLKPKPAAKPAVEAPKAAAPAPKPAPPKAAAKPAKAAPKRVDKPAKAAPTDGAPPPGTLVVKESSGGTVTKTRRRAPAGKPPPETTTTITTSASGNVTTTRNKGKPSAASAEATPVAKPRGGESPAAARGRQVHEEFKQKVAQRPGWNPKPTLLDANNRKLHPDALTRNKNPIELKPNTPSGRAAGKRQIKKYEAASEGKKKGRVIYYDP